MKHIVYRGTVLLAASSLLASCGGGGSNGIPSISSTNPIATGKLAFAVGTANIYGTTVGLNVVATYRQSNGLSNVLVDTPSITGPFTLPASAPAGGLGFDPYSSLPGGPSVEEVAQGGVIGGTSQALHPGTPACDQTTACNVPSASGGTASVAPNTSTFGQAGGVFVNGISPGNSTNSGVAASYVPYVEPLYDASSNAFEPFGGPPAFDPNGTGLGLRDGLQNLGAGVAGIPEGFTTFEGVTPGAGTYTLTVQVPTSPTAFGSVSATSTLASTAQLPAITAPALTLDGNGGGSFTVAALPAGVTEEYVQIVDSGDGGTNCQGPTGPPAGPAVYYTFVVKAPGTFTLADTIGPNTNITAGQNKAALTPSPSICTSAQNTAASGGTATTGDSYSVQAIGLDYPMYEATYPINKTQSPTLAGTNGQADITISAPTTGTSP